MDLQVAALCRPSEDGSGHDWVERDLSWLLRVPDYPDPQTRARLLRSAYDHERRRNRCLTRESEGTIHCLWIGECDLPGCLEIVGTASIGPRSSATHELLCAAGTLAATESRILRCRLAEGVSRRELARAGLAVRTVVVRVTLFGRAREFVRATDE